MDIIGSGSMFDCKTFRSKGCIASTLRKLNPSIPNLLHRSSSLRSPSFDEENIAILLYTSLMSVLKLYQEDVELHVELYSPFHNPSL